MRLDRAVAKFAKNHVWGWNESRKCFEPTGKKGSLWVYDKFISDRTFGTKKRLLNTPRQDYIPTQYEYIRVGDSIARFMVDSLNEDVYADSPYANTYLLREAKYEIEIGSLRGEKRASGAGGKKEFVVDSVMFGDYERYTGSGSTEFNTVDYTVSDIFLPLSAQIDSTNLVRVDGKMYEITEVSRVSNLLWIRAQKLAEDHQVEVQRHALYECDLVNNWGVPDYTVVSGGPLEVEFTKPCHTRLIQIGEHAFSGTASCACVDGSTHYEMALYDVHRNLLAHSNEGSLAFAGTADGPFLLSIVPLHFEDAGAATINIGVTPAEGGWGEVYGLYYGSTAEEECVCNV